MRRYAGFTLVELLITITIMVILVSIGVVSLRASQVSARDDDRATDVANIARALEDFYNSGNTTVSNPGYYPPVSLTSGDEASIMATLPNLDKVSLEAPGMTASSLVAATVATETTAGIQPQPTINQYVYQPLRQDATLCTDSGSCSRFNLYYRSEADNTIHMIASKHQ